MRFPPGIGKGGVVLLNFGQPLLEIRPCRFEVATGFFFFPPETRQSSESFQAVSAQENIWINLYTSSRGSVERLYCFVDRLENPFSLCVIALHNTYIHDLLVRDQCEVAVRTGIECSHGRFGITPGKGNVTFSFPKRSGQLLLCSCNGVIDQSFGIFVPSQGKVQYRQAVCRVLVAWVQFRRFLAVT